ncbi:hypothetical protein ABFX02_08G141300 [Erythranthe guttata]
MGMVGSIGRWIEKFGKKQCRSLYWRIRAATKKKSKGSKRRVKIFQYDAYSYALNFDDGLGIHEQVGPTDADYRHHRRQPKFPEFTIWVCVVLPK